MIQSHQIDNNVLASLLEEDAVPMSTLHKRYGSLLELVRVLIGVVPNCDSYLEIWPPAFRTYNVIVPNFLNLPFSLFGVGGAQKDMVGMAMYVSSRSAECAYCSAHTCSFALRRGAAPEKIAQALLGGAEFNSKELATIVVARSLAQIPCALTAQEKQEFKSHYSEAEAEWVVLGVAMMGFLNKFMDAIGVALEDSTVAETKELMGSDWSAGKAGRALVSPNSTIAAPTADTLRTKLSVVRYAPAALKLDSLWQRGVPKSWPKVGEFLLEEVGYDFPLLARMTNAKGIRAVATVLRENLNDDNSGIGIKTKLMAGVIFATEIEDAILLADIKHIAAGRGIKDIDFEKLQNGGAANKQDVDNAQQGALLTLAQAASPSPAVITESVVSVCRDAHLSAEAIVEMITWLSVLQMLHRLSCYFQEDVS